MIISSVVEKLSACDVVSASRFEKLIDECEIKTCLLVECCSL